MYNLITTQGITKALETVGGSSKYQIRVLFILFIQNLLRGSLMMYYPYINRAPIFLCEDPNSSGHFYDCTENNGGCETQTFSPNSPSSLAIDLGLYCGLGYVRTLAGTFFFFGGNIGSVVFSYISDQKGRKTALFFSHFFGAISMCLILLASSGPVSYTVNFMLVWTSLSCFFTISSTYISEVSNEQFAKIGTSTILLSITTGEIIIILLAYLIPNWKTVFFGFIAVPSLLSTLTFLLLDETPVYYISKNQANNAAHVLQKIANVNEKFLDFQPDSDINLNISIKEANPTTNQPELPVQPTQSGNYLQIIKNPSLRLRVAILSIVKFYLSVVYCGAIIALSDIGGSIYASSIVTASAEALGYCLSFKAPSYPMRNLLKRSLQTVVVTGISFLLIPILSCDNFFICSPITIQNILALILRTCICFIYAFICPLGNGLFPPEVRSQSIGISDFFSALGGMLSPSIIAITQIYRVNPLFLFGLLGLPTLVASSYLPVDETQINNEEPSHEHSRMPGFKALTENRKIEANEILHMEQELDDSTEKE